MIDYSLYGMNFVHYSDVKFRRNSIGTNANNFDFPVSQNSNSSLADYFDPNKIEDSLLGPPGLTKMTLCELEVDVIASDIIIDNNRSGIFSLDPHNFMKSLTLPIHTIYIYALVFDLQVKLCQLILE